MLLVLEPLTLVFLTIEESVGAKTLTLTLLVLAFIPVAVLIGGLSLAMRVSLNNLSLELSPIFRGT